MIWLRSLVFNVYFFGVTFLLSLWGVLLRVLAPDRIFALARFWAGLVLAGARVICRLDLRVTGLDQVSPGRPVLLACQHQSAFDTLIWMTLLPRPSYVVKQELTRIPLFGPLLIAAGMIPVDRHAGGAAMRSLLRATQAAHAQGRQIVIFPEGTRVAPGQHVKLQPGIAAIAQRLAVPVVPVATNSGLFWGRNAFHKSPGTIQVHVGAPVSPTVGRVALLSGIETAWRASERQGFQPVDNPVEKSWA